MSQFLDTLDAGCVSVDAFPRNPAFSPALPDRGWVGKGAQRTQIQECASATLPLHSTFHSPPADARLSERAKIQQSVAYMIEHLTERMQVSQLAALVSVSPSYFFALFKRQTGYAPIDFLIRLRMRRACSLLDKTGLSIKQI